MKDNKIIILKKKTRLDDLIYRYNTLSQAKFYIESLQADFNEYIEEHETYQNALNKTAEILSRFGRLHIVDSKFLPNFIFGEKDLVVAVGRDGLVVNTIKYLTNHCVIGVNPDPKRYDGVLLPFKVDDLNYIVPVTLKGGQSVKEITMAKVILNDKQTLYAVNDLFIGHKSHESARYEVTYLDEKEKQSSSGIIVSTGFGSTGWLKSVLAGASGVTSALLNKEIKLNKQMNWDDKKLYFSVREPFPSKNTKTNTVFGEITHEKRFKVLSQMPENGVIFSDGVESDFLVFNSGTEANIQIAEKKGLLVV